MLARNALNLALAILHHVDRTLTGRARSARAFLIIEAVVLAKVNGAGELTDKYHIHALDNLGPQRRGPLPAHHRS